MLAQIFSTIRLSGHNTMKEFNVYRHIGLKLWLSD